MAYVAVDKDGTECIYTGKPFRNEDEDELNWQASWSADFFELPKGSIAKLIGRELTWNHEPVELKETKDKE